jgi:hypothetical protein
MMRDGIELQSAIDKLIGMIEGRMEEYVRLRRQLPSFGLEVDKELARYHENLENMVQGMIMWHYASPSKSLLFGLDGIFS